MKRTTLSTLAVGLFYVLPLGAGAPEDPAVPDPNLVPPPGDTGLPPAPDDPPPPEAPPTERADPAPVEPERRRPSERAEPAKPAEATPEEKSDAITGRLTEVTLYQGMALVTRHVDLPDAKQGPIEIVVSPLPTATDPSSVFADRAQGVEVRSVACRSRPPAEAAKLKSEVHRLDLAIKDLGEKIATSKNEIALRRIRQDYLKSLGNFVAPAVSQEMAHGILQAKEIEAVTQMHFKEYETASQEIMEFDFEIEEDQEKLGDLRKEREKLAAGPPLTYDAVLYLEKTKAGPASLELNYLVKDCGWSPVYNVRGDMGNSEIEIEFNALIHQVSGEDWGGVKLALSTASPTVSAYNPQLAPLYVNVTPNGQQETPSNRVGQQGNRAIYAQAQIDQKAAMKGQFRGQSFDEAANANFTANESAASVQLIELSERMSELRRMRDDISEDELSIEYSLNRPVTLVSRRDAQMVPVLQHRSKAAFHHVAVPILTSSVFREAELTNATEQDLLGGKVNVYLDGRFTGRTDIPTIARGRNFTMGFGVDGQLRARRSLVDRSEAVQGGNKHLEISVEVVFDNYKQKPVDIRLRERTPTMEDAASLRVVLGEMSHPLSEDSDYQRFDKPKGILLWDFNVKPGSGKDSTSLSYTYSLEFDKSLTLQDISREQKSRIRTEFIQQSKRASFKGKPMKK